VPQLTHGRGLGGQHPGSACPVRGAHKQNLNLRATQARRRVIIA
jgi:hypothetical protein